ncbi:MAG: hypothetical protein VYC19_06105 [Pseudomonadota bacterium]|jgi:precorrin-2 methylase|nr:hypothetical protein [Alphaproteobacteria bacterium]MEC7702308.1 hypothetical protein [Pseudomonadota bacterium]|tara:strand:+ start:1027 stop:1281 length:255 start_codon:yes stop_codon:yes gene_type:complete
MNIISGPTPISSLAEDQAEYLVLLRALDVLVLHAKSAEDHFSASILESCYKLIEARKKNVEDDFPVSHEDAAKIARATLMSLID